MRLPDELDDMLHWELSRDMHAVYYQTPAEMVADLKHLPPEGSQNWEHVYHLSVYPDTPTGFYTFLGSTLEEVVKGFLAWYPTWERPDR